MRKTKEGRCKALELFVASGYVCHIMCTVDNDQSRAACMRLKRELERLYHLTRCSQLTMAPTTVSEVTNSKEDESAPAAAAPSKPCTGGEGCNGRLSVDHTMIADLQVLQNVSKSIANATVPDRHLTDGPKIWCMFLFL